jgi:precorrin-6A/cobalt-precorrin-6A reductase
MRRVLILGGTAEGRRLAERLVAAGVPVVSSLAGRLRRPELPPGEVRMGGFGGPEALGQWLRDEHVGAVVDATHPFAAQITAHAVAAAEDAGVPLLVVRRPGWTASPGDVWVRRPTLAAAAEALDDLGGRVLLTTGRQGLAAFAGRGEWFLVRVIDVGVGGGERGNEQPHGPLPPRCRVITARGPFTVDGEEALLREHAIDVVVTKDSGGDATAAKLVAARHLGLPVVVVDRPPLPAGVTAVEDVEAAVTWAGARAGRAGPGGTMGR